MEHILKCARLERSQGLNGVLVTIAASQGSTPRTTGAAMLVGHSGILAGTIGGGALEYECAMYAGHPPKPLMEFELNREQAAGLGMVCGGSAQVLFTPLTDDALLTQALDRLEEGQPGWLRLPLDGSAPALADSGPEKPALVEGCLVMPLAQPGRVYLFGGGHVSLALSRLLDVLEYPYIVVDDRPEFANEYRFPGAKLAISSEYTELSKLLSGKWAPAKGDCLCIMTRGHLADTDALRFALTTPAEYIGVMGSRKKRDRVLAQLVSEGYADAPQRIITPIGLPIGGQTPAEVATSIAAQLVQIRNADG